MCHSSLESWRRREEDNVMSCLEGSVGWTCIRTDTISYLENFDGRDSVCRGRSICDVRIVIMTMNVQCIVVCIEG